MYVFKKQLLYYMVNELLTAKDIPATCKAQIREVAKSFHTFREKVGYRRAK